MKNISLLLFSALISLIAVPQLIAQVGVGTTDPQEMLHVGGANSTIRIDGLNSNNPNNDGLRKVPLSVDADGNLVLEKPVSDRFINKENFLLSPQELGTKIEYKTKLKSIYQYQVTTSNEAKLLLVSYQIGTLLTQEDDTSKKIEQNHEQKLFGFAIVAKKNSNEVTAAEFASAYAISSNPTIANKDSYDTKFFVTGQALVPLLDTNETYYFHIVAFISNSKDDKGIRAYYGDYGGTNENLDRFQLFEMN